MTTLPVLTGQDIGRAHYAVRALLEHRLKPSGLDFERWVPLNLVGSKGVVPESELIATVATGLKLGREDAQRRIADLLEAGLVTSAEDNALGLSEAGRELWTHAATEVRPLTDYLFEGFSEDDKLTAARILGRVTERADAALADTD